MTKKVHPNIRKALYKRTRMAPGADPKVVSHGHAQTVLENSRFSNSQQLKKIKKAAPKSKITPRRDSDDAVVDYDE